MWEEMTMEVEVIKMKITNLLLILLLLLSTVGAVILTVPETIDQTSGNNITWTFIGVGGVKNCTLSGPFLQSIITNNTIGCSINGTCNSATWWKAVIPGANANIGCSKTISLSCFNCTNGDEATCIQGENSSTTACVYDFKAGDIDDVASDVIGEGLFSFKTYMTLIALGIILV